MSPFAAERGVDIVIKVPASKGNDNEYTDPLELNADRNKIGQGGLCCVPQAGLGWAGPRCTVLFWAGWLAVTY